MDAKTKAMKVAVDHQNNLLDARDKAARLVQDREDNRAALAMEAHEASGRDAARSKTG